MKESKLMRFWSCLTLTLLLVAVLAACGRSEASTPTPHTIVEFTDHRGAAVSSLEERAYLSDIIVRASLVSTGDRTLTFNAVEYLKGTGDQQFTISISTGDRNTKWDTREAVLFLSNAEAQAGGEGSGSSGPARGTRSSGTTFSFADTTSWDYAWRAGSYTGARQAGHSIDSNNPVWIPSTQSGGASGQLRSTASNFITESESPDGEANPEVSLGDIRRAIAWVDGGQGVAGYDACVERSLRHQRTFRDSQAYWGDVHLGPDPESYVIASGSKAGTLLYQEVWQGGGSQYPRFTLSGPNAELFTMGPNDPDGIPSPYTLETAPTRPLPAGVYTFKSHYQSENWFVCNYHSPYSVTDWTITVTAPAGTLHEAFFDPVSSGDAVGYFGAGDALKPASFSIGDVDTTIQSLKWQDSAATLGLSPYNALTGQILDFITGDGTTSLSLEASAATGDSTAGTLTWAVGSQPWSSGDELMLRLRDSQTTPSFSQDSYTFSVAESTSTFTVIGTVKAVDQDGDAVLHKITSGGDGGRFNIDGWRGDILLMRALDYETRTSYELTVTGTDPGGRSDSTTVTINVTDVAE